MNRLTSRVALIMRKLGFIIRIPTYRFFMPDEKCLFRKKKHFLTDIVWIIIHSNLWKDFNAFLKGPVKTLYQGLFNDVCRKNI